MSKFDMMTVKELREYVKEHEYKISGVSKMKKADLVTALINFEYDLNKEDDQKDLDEFVESISDDNEVFNGGIGIYEMVEVEEYRNNNEDGIKKIARKNATAAYNWIVGGLENSLSDYDEDSDDYKEAYRLLHTVEGTAELREWIYSDSVKYEFDAGYMGGEGSAPKEMKFATKEFILQVINDLLKNDGYFNTEESVEDRVHELDEVVASISPDPNVDLTYEKTKKNAKPKVVPYRNKFKYYCPFCDEYSYDMLDFCYNCGMQLNHMSERYDRIHGDNNSHNPEKPMISKRKDSKLKICPSCDGKIWFSDHFCKYCGQKVKNND